LEVKEGTASLLPGSRRKGRTESSSKRKKKKKKKKEGAPGSAAVRWGHDGKERITSIYFTQRRGKRGHATTNAKKKKAGVRVPLEKPLH